MPYKRDQKTWKSFQLGNEMIFFHFCLSFCREQLAQHYCFPLKRWHAIWCSKSGELCRRQYRTMNPTIFFQPFVIYVRWNSIMCNEQWWFNGNSSYPNGEDARRKLLKKKQKQNPTKKWWKHDNNKIRKHNTTAFSNWNNCLFVSLFLSHVISFIACYFFGYCGINVNP